MMNNTIMASDSTMRCEMASLVISDGECIPKCYIAIFHSEICFSTILCLKIRILQNIDYYFTEILYQMKSVERIPDNYDI